MTSGRQKTSSGQHQFGAGTVVPPDVQLILADCFETLVELRGRSYVARQGVVEFLRHFGQRMGIPVVVVSDGALPAVEQALEQAHVRQLVHAVLAAPESLEPLPDGRARKRLDVAIALHKVARARTVFIGDSPLDAEAAKHHQVPFIRVPRSEDEKFTFANLIHGPSRYNSQEFSATMLEKYLGKKP
jgi:phosphoglycolate phosphatase-like HAD superfamily hydrolase